MKKREETADVTMEECGELIEQQSNPTKGKTKYLRNRG